jgi:hypothetical protein
MLHTPAQLLDLVALDVRAFTVTRFTFAHAYTYLAAAMLGNPETHSQGVALCKLVTQDQHWTQRAHDHANCFAARIPA